MAGAKPKRVGPINKLSKATACTSQANQSKRRACVSVSRPAAKAGNPGPEGSIAKLALAEFNKAVDDGKLIYDDASGKWKNAAKAMEEVKQAAVEVVEPIKLTVDEALRLFAAAGVPARGTLFLALAGKEELAANWMNHEMGEFWDELVSSMPGTLNDALQDKFNEVRPRWAVGTSKLVARLVSEHIDDIASRDLSLALGR